MRVTEEPFYKDEINDCVDTRTPAYEDKDIMQQKYLTKTEFNKLVDILRHREFWRELYYDKEILMLDIFRNGSYAVSGDFLPANTKAKDYVFSLNIDKKKSVGHASQHRKLAENYLQKLHYYNRYGASSDLPDYDLSGYDRKTPSLFPGFDRIYIFDDMNWDQLSSHE